jgi:hypothetical protein
MINNIPNPKTDQNLNTKTTNSLEEKSKIKQRYIANREHIRRVENIAEGVRAFVDKVKALMEKTGEPLHIEASNTMPDRLVGWEAYDYSSTTYKVGNEELLSQATYQSPYDNLDYYIALETTINEQFMDPLFVEMLKDMTQNNPELGFSELLVPDETYFPVNYDGDWKERPDNI